jgi:adenosylhomocysteine nucleosidase
MQILVCALTCEAMPLIEHFQLRSLSNELPFRIYQREERSLLVTGVGKSACACACSFFAGKFFSKEAIWLNVGVCGGNERIGTPFLVHKIQEDHRAYYPSFTFPLPCKTASLVSCEKPQKEIDHFLYDMEGAGFFAAAQHFSPLEWIHLLKIISDNGAKRLEKKEVSTLISQHIPLIEKILEQLQSQKQTESVIEAPHLSKTQQHQLKRSLERCEALGISPPSLHLDEIQKLLKAHVPTNLR